MTSPTWSNELGSGSAVGSESGDLGWLREIVVELLQTPTQVPQGQTELAPGDENIKRAVNDVVVPMIEQLQPDEIRVHPDGDVAARFGPVGDCGLLMQTYVVSQHANLMSAESAGRVVPIHGDSLMDASVSGQGATQNKGAMASALLAVRRRPEDLRQPIWLTVNTEGKSSHAGSSRILDDLEVKAAAGILTVGTGLRVSLGNRGRADARVTITGLSAHSSQPWLGHNPIADAADVLVALRTAPLPQDHEFLGPVALTPYQVWCEPVSPHTIPEFTNLQLDRRLLPGESPVAAVDGIRAHLQECLPDISATVEAGEVMLPAVVDADAPVVAALTDGLRAETGQPGETFWSLNTFDAGYACSKGIPTVMFGPGDRHFSGPGLLDEDAVSFRDLWTGAAVYNHVIAQLCA